MSRIANPQEWVGGCSHALFLTLEAGAMFGRGPEGPGQPGAGPVAFDGGVPLRVNTASLGQIVGIGGEERQGDMLCLWRLPILRCLLGELFAGLRLGSSGLPRGSEGCATGWCCESGRGGKTLGGEEDLFISFPERGVSSSPPLATHPRPNVWSVQPPRLAHKLNEEGRGMRRCLLLVPCVVGGMACPGGGRQFDRLDSEGSIGPPVDLETRGKPPRCAVHVRC
jgi:hypothetical protein